MVLQSGTLVFFKVVLVYIGRKLLSTEIIPRDAFSYSQRPPKSLPHLSENRSEAQRECENRKSSLFLCFISLYLLTVVGMVKESDLT